LSPRDVVITGIGLATPLGGSFETFTQCLFDGGAVFEALHTRHAAPIPAARVHEDLTATLARSEKTVGDRSSHLALVASTRALQHAGWAAGDPALQRCGVFVGCGSGPTHALDDVYAAIHLQGRMPGLALLRCLPSGAAAAVAIRHGLRGPSHTYASACASSTIAIGEALRAIRHGYLDMALVGGSEAPFGDVTVKAWEALRVLAPAGDDAGRACRPFDRHRSGLVLGEGAAFFVLESAAAAAERGAQVHARLAGYGGSGDGHHWTEPNAAGQMQAMRAALADAHLAPSDIHAINAHGTATLLGDRAEARSIAEVFGTGADAPWVHSTKSLHGHALGASGALELAAVIAALRERRLPATRNLEQPDDLPLHLVAGAPRALPPGANVLSNSFAFGGSNACLVVTADAA
jgi:3-oxoacyl-[acyl-carrier-protein] synthase II